MYGETALERMLTVGQSVSVETVPDVDPLASLVGGALGSFLTTLAVGAILIALAPDYTENKIETIRTEPVGSALYGLVYLLGLGLVAFFLVLSIIGILVAVPLLVVAVVVWAVGAAIAFLAIGEALLGHDEGWLRPLALGAGINGALTLTGAGALVALAIGAAGFGAVLRDWVQ